MESQNPHAIVAVFTEEQTVRLTGVSQRQLRNWDRDGFFVPSLAYEDRGKPFSRLYSFRDLVSLKIVNALRNDAGVTLSHLRGVKEKLAHLGDDMWAKTSLFVLNKEVVFVNPETQAKEAVLSQQGILQIPLEVVTGDMRAAVRALRQRDATTIGKIDRRRGVASNQAVVAGTRIPVRTIKTFAKAGYSIDQIKAEYPTLTDEDIRAAIKYHEAA